MTDGPLAPSDRSTARTATSQFTDRPSSLLSKVLPLVAPLTVAMTGMFYLAGHTLRMTRLRQFGLSGSMFEHSIQDTLAEGYVPTLIAIAIVVGGLLFSWRFIGFHKWFRASAAAGPRPIRRRANASSKET